jgi:hypothetical protein
MKFPKIPWKVSFLHLGRRQPDWHWEENDEDARSRNRDIHDRAQMD